MFSLICLWTGGCSALTMRPVQEMAIAEAALRAAREVNADALENSPVPEMYRSAADALSKAKKEYKLKNFDRAKQYALKCIQLAEKAEYEAIKAGGATPEAANARGDYAPEGASLDTYNNDGSINTEPAGSPPVQTSTPGQPSTPAPGGTSLPPQSPPGGTIPNDKKSDPKNNP